MKRALLTIIVMLWVTMVFAQAHIMCGVQDEMIKVYINDTLNITSIRVYNSESDITVARNAFGTSYPEHTRDNIYFDLHQNYYKLYVPEMKTVFTVQSTPGKNVSLGPHLVWMILYIRDCRQQNY